MALDIKEGDILTVSSTDYPIRALEEWSNWSHGRRGLKRFLKVTASTKRVPSISSGKRGTPTTKLTGVACTPLDPVDPELRQRLAINTPHELLQTIADGGSTFYRLILEDLKA